MAKLLFLGVANDKIASGGQLKSSEGIYLEFKNHKILIDPGPQASIKLNQHKINIRNITEVLISHFHCADLNILIDTITNGGLTQKCTLIAPLEATDYSLEKTSLIPKNELENIHFISPGQYAKSGALSFQGLKIKHKNYEGIGFKIIGDNLSLVYSGNTKHTEEISDLYVGASILILNIATPSTNDLTFNSDYLNIDDAIKILKKVKPKLAVIQNFSEKISNPIYHARKIQKETGVQTIAANDDMTIDLDSYSALNNQKTLGGF